MSLKVATEAGRMLASGANDFHPFCGGAQLGAAALNTPIPSG